MLVDTVTTWSWDEGEVKAESPPKSLVDSMRAPHKLKSAVSGCIRECAEARCKDFGIIATAEGWNLYVCGNGGANPRHGELLAAGPSME